MIGTAKAAGLFDGACSHIGGWAEAQLLAVAKASSGIASDAALEACSAPALSVTRRSAMLNRTTFLTGLIRSPP